MKIWLYEKIKEIRSMVERIDANVTNLLLKEKHMSAELDALVDQVAEENGVIDSVVTLLEGIDARLDALVAQLEAAGVDTATLVALKNDIKAHSDALAAAAAAVPPAA